jgi:hypothetical protein
MFRDELLDSLRGHGSRDGEENVRATKYLLMKPLQCGSLDAANVALASRGRAAVGMVLINAGSKDAPRQITIVISALAQGGESFALRSRQVPGS